MKKVTKSKKAKIKTDTKDKKKSFLLERPILSVTIKSLFLIIIIGTAIIYSDYKGYFNPDETNNHTKKKWDAFYEFTDNNNIDVLLLGSSHLYTGINPKNLSATLGVNSFILASPGTNIADTYYGLKEAIKTTKPKLVVIETYGISDFIPHNLKDGGLSDQFKSFNARKDFPTKISSMPFLFKTDNYLYAFSNTLRNHNFIFEDPAQLEKNQKLIGSNQIKSNKLYLGRYVRFTTGLEDNIISKYNSLGAPVDGNEYAYNDYTIKYVKNIVDLCKENDIELVFLTLPMYYKHIKDYAVWNKRLSEILNTYPNKWFNMQAPYDKESFSKICFENTYSSNQHMTYQGSLIATYKLADFIKSELDINLPNRKKEQQWLNHFYGEEGYFENNSVLENDKNNKLLCKNLETNNILLNEVSIIRQNNRSTMLIAKIDRSKNKDTSFRKCKLRLEMSYMNGNKLELANIDLQYDLLHEISDKAIFKVSINPIEIIEVKSGMLFCE